MQNRTPRDERYRLKHKKEIDIYQKKYRQENKNKIKKCNQKYYLKNKEKIREKQKIYDKLNPRSRGSNYSIELQTAMVNVRKRDHNTCQWQNCGLTHREAPIHVHHIFPRSEYPTLQLIENYMICYCANHHGMWHRYRGDQNAINFLQQFDSVVAVLK